MTELELIDFAAERRQKPEIALVDFRLRLRYSSEVLMYQ
jgi:hypothetical protein